MSLVLPSVIGHRGAARHAPENTLAGLRKAAEQRVPWVEFDVMLTADGTAVLHHDETLKRITGLDRPMAELTYAELAGLDAGSWFGAAFADEPVPTFEEALACLGALGLGANVEIKPTEGREVETARVAARILRRCWPASLPQPLISSFRRASLAAMQAAAPELPRGLLAEGLPDDWRAAVAELGCASVHLWRKKLTRAAVEAVKTAGFGLAVYTVNDPEEAVAFRGWGVDAIITDDPPAILAGLAAAGLA
ncbi:glycerophosphoryl diester phosphodiesterase [Tistlia consotensis]|uniref:Glycerophosphoryl diester phosphodiesterase n=1 Tax=Tistlia consotensis USBA 355 TaxID=560819 RepID=A0A1Y6CLJ1_9PROT|nr:glycerophosphodiester phosphodiesterase [Tistlia consotensis]SMF74610.1 glycerophosphoryl diester phosphodiesterase [Tistlia consotensis USBA 355]SNS10952.1 glycerophosphoryl diester phosphodiesterase [Tistlia consotensis]